MLGCRPVFEAELGGDGESVSRQACSAARLLGLPPTQMQPLLHEAGLSGPLGAAWRLLGADDGRGSGTPPLSLGLTSLSPSPEMGLTRSDQQRPPTSLWGVSRLEASRGPWEVDASPSSSSCYQQETLRTGCQLT